MKKFFAICLLFSLTTSLFSQNVTFDFENLSMPDTGFWNGADTSVYKNGYFGDNFVSFNNNLQEYSWGGFAFSNWTDTVWATYNNQWSAYSGEAYSDSIFGLGYIDYYYGTFPTITFSGLTKVQSIAFTNSTYTALVIRDGNNYSRAFSTDSADFYKILLYGLNQEDTVWNKEVFLADYRTMDSVIVKDWLNVDLSELDSISSIVFDAVTTDMGAWGANTPLYFCIDDIVYSSLSADIDKNKVNSLKVYPNPASNYLVINDYVQNISIYNSLGVQIQHLSVNSANPTINISTLPNGIYLLKVQTQEGYKNAQFIKK